MYDYGGKDKNSHTRKSHLNQSKNVIDITTTESSTTPKIEMINDNCYAQSAANHFLTTEEQPIKDILDFQKSHTYCLVLMINGHGQVSVNNKVYRIDKGDHFILAFED